MKIFFPEDDILTPLVALCLLVVILGTAAFLLFPLPRHSSACEVVWDGEIALPMVQRVRQDLRRAEEAKCAVLHVAVFSSGGEVFPAIEIAREMRRAQHRGLVIETHGRSLVASAAILLVGAGTSGHRYVDRGALIIVHAISSGGVCVERSVPPVTEEQAVSNRVLEVAIEELSALSGKSPEEVSRWVRCGGAQAGNGSLLVSLGLADQVE